MNFNINNMKLTRGLHFKIKVNLHGKLMHKHDVTYKWNNQ